MVKGRMLRYGADACTRRVHSTEMLQIARRRLSRWVADASAQSVRISHPDDVDDEEKIVLMSGRCQCTVQTSYRDDAADGEQRTLFKREDAYTRDIPLTEMM